MTVSPVVIGVSDTLAQARRVMRERGIRHLPVLDGGRLVGVLSRADILRQLHLREALDLQARRN